MAWIKVKSSITNKVFCIQENAYNNYYKNTKIFTVIEEPQKKSENAKKPKEDIENVENTQFTIENEVNSSGKNQKKARV